MSVLHLSSFATESQFSYLGKKIPLVRLLTEGVYQSFFDMKKTGANYTHNFTAKFWQYYFLIT